MSGKDLVKKLKSEGWTVNRIHGSHHILVRGDKTLTVPVHGAKDLGAGLLNKLLKEAGLK